MNRVFSLSIAVPLGILLFLLSAVLHAENRVALLSNNPNPIILEYNDLNDEGILSLNELSARHIEQFSKADFNQDKGLSLDEFISLREAQRLVRIKYVFKRMDSNKDDLVNNVEFNAVFPGSRAMGDAIFEQMTEDSEQLTFEVFSLKRLVKGVVYEELLWEFAKLDRNANQVLSLQEFIASISFHK